MLSESPSSSLNATYTPEQRFFEEPVTDRLLAASITLAAEVYVLRERLAALEHRVAGMAGEPIPPVDAASDAAQFVKHILDPLLGQQQSRGYL